MKKTFSKLWRIGTSKICPEMLWSLYFHKSKECEATKICFYHNCVELRWHCIQMRKTGHQTVKDMITDWLETGEERAFQTLVSRMETVVQNLSLAGHLRRFCTICRPAIQKAAIHFINFKAHTILSVHLIVLSISFFSRTLKTFWPVYYLLLWSEW